MNSILKGQSDMHIYRIDTFFKALFFFYTLIPIPLYPYILEINQRIKL